MISYNLSALKWMEKEFYPKLSVFNFSHRRKWDTWKKLDILLFIDNKKIICKNIERGTDASLLVFVTKKMKWIVFYSHNNQKNVKIALFNPNMHIIECKKGGRIWASNKITNLLIFIYHFSQTWRVMIIPIDLKRLINEPNNYYGNNFVYFKDMFFIILWKWRNRWRKQPKSHLISCNYVKLLKIR